ncbi:MAG: ABC transporter ATP-binding protein [Eubacterium sp.]|nr:ABC transporter ATP-binding protein [Eubacterium sp.]
MIQAKHLVKTFTRQVDKKKKEEFNAVDDMSLTVNDGELVGILGPNGAGKTTLLRMLATLMTPTSGEITVSVKSGRTWETTADSGKNYGDFSADVAGEEDVLSTSIQIRRHLGYLSANTKLYERFSVRETMSLFGETYGMSKEEIENRIIFLTNILELQPFLDQRVGKLSTGQLQRAQIARCLMHDPEIYIFDEPTLGLDVISSSAIINFMKNEKYSGKTILYSTHYMEEAQYLCDRVILLNKGRILCEDTPEHLMESTGTKTMREAFFSTIGEEETGNTP